MHPRRVGLARGQRSTVSGTSGIKLLSASSSQHVATFCAPARKGFVKNLEWRMEVAIKIEQARQDAPSTLTTPEGT